MTISLLFFSASIHIMLVKASKQRGKNSEILITGFRVKRTITDFAFSNKAFLIYLLPRQQENIAACLWFAIMNFLIKNMNKKNEVYAFGSTYQQMHAMLITKMVIFGV
ncbi:hypothetical protein ACJX0J_005798 [Zea mays]